MENLTVAIFDPEIFEMVKNAETEKNQKKIKTFQSKEVQAISKVSKVQLINWTEQRVIIPLIDAQGRGKVRVYDFQSLIETMIARELTNFSMSVRFCAEVLKWLRETEWTFRFLFDRYEFETLQELKKLITTPTSGEIPSDTRIKPETPKVDRIERVHTVWEFLRIYPISLFSFVLVVSVGCDRISVFVCDVEKSALIFETKSAVIVNLNSLVAEAGDPFENAGDG